MNKVKRNKVKRHLKRLSALKRKSYHPLVHKVHQKYHISKKTLFYIKEYGPHSNVPRTIIEESIKITLLASVISSVGGLALEQVKTVLLAFIPLIILLPAMNDMVGNYAAIVSSRFSTMLHLGQVRGKIQADAKLRTLFAQVIVLSLMTASAGAAIALVISHFVAQAVDFNIAFKVFLIAIVDAMALVCILFLVAVFAGIYFFKKNEDPNNFLIPITTALGDFGNMILLSLLTFLFFGLG